MLTRGSVRARRQQMLGDLDATESGQSAMRPIETTNGSLCLDWPQQLSGAPPAYMGLLGWRPLESTITGFVVEVAGLPCHSIKVGWRYSVVRSAEAPLVLWPCAASEIADITLDDSTQTCGTVMDIMRALLDNEPAARGAHQARQQSSARAFDAGARHLAAWPDQVRQAVAVEFGGPMLPVLDLLARQQLLDRLGGRKLPWRSILRDYQDLDATGSGSFLPVRLWGSGTWPSRRLESRLKNINSVPLLDAFVRVAALIPTDRERRLFEQALTDLLKQVFEGRVQLGQRAAGMEHNAWVLLVSMAERTAFMQYRIAACQADDHPPMFLDLQFPFEPLASSVRSTPFRRPLGARRLLALVRRWSREMISRLQREDFDVRLFRLECNELAQAVIAGAWTIEDLSSRTWEELCALDAAIDQYAQIKLPELNWPAEVPQDGQACLEEAGLLALPVACSADLRLEADEMQNCLASSRVYFDGLVTGQLKVYSIHGLIRATMAFAFDGKAWELTEFCDDEGCNLIPELQAADAPEWMALHGFAGHVANLPGPKDVGVGPDASWGPR